LQFGKIFENSLDILIKQRADFAALKLNRSRLKLGILKGYMDGSLGSRTAAMLAPYSDDPKNSGIPRKPADEMITMIVERNKACFQIGLHAIGDRANRIALDGFRSIKFSRLKTSRRTFETSEKGRKNQSASQNKTIAL